VPELATVAEPSTIDPALLLAARAFAERHPDALVRDREGRIPPTVLGEAAELGLFGLSVPEEHGGLGLGLGPTAAIVAELARVDRAIATTIGLHNGLGTRAIVTGGSRELKDALLPALATGDRIGAFSATEPGAGSDLTQLSTIATRTPGGLRVTGQKAYVTNAGFAGCFTVLCRSEQGGRATVLLAVPAETSGVVLGQEEKKMGLRASSTRAVHFDGVEVPFRSLLGDPEAGGMEAHRALTWGRTLMAAGCLGTTRAALERTLAHARERRQFKRALSSFGVVQRHLAAIATGAAAIEATLAAVTDDAAKDRSIEASSAALKVLASELSCDACDRAVQVHGALGFVEDSGVALLLRDARVTRIFEGANDVLLLRLGSALVAGHGLSAGTSEVQGRFGGVVDEVQRRLGVQAIRHQSLLVALARVDVALFGAEACRTMAKRATPVLRSTLEAAQRRLEASAASALAEVPSADLAEQGDAALVTLLGEDAAELVRPAPNRIHA
jgi:alkylation response protein AidB-like acyl-CoA dehydrogenase